jgi:hypothetical protein
VAIAHYATSPSRDKLSYHYQGLLFKGEDRLKKWQEEESRTAFAL